MAALSVEPAYASLTVEPAYAFNLLIGWGGYGRAPPDLMVEPMAALLVERATHPDGPYGRACLRILTSRACLRTLKVQFTYWVGGLMVEPAYASLTVEPACASLSVEPMAALLVERATHPDGPHCRQSHKGSLIKAVS